MDGTGVPLLVEVKRPGQAPVIAEILNRTGLNPDNLIVWAREPFSWDEYHGVLPGVRQVTGALNLSVLTDSFLAGRSAAGDFGLAIQPVGLTEALVEQIHSYGLLIYGIPNMKLEKRLVEIWAALDKKGIDRDFLLSRSMLSPATCCLVNPDGEKTVEKAFEMTGELSLRLRDKLGFIGG